MTRADRITHLIGYAGIVAVLAAATWSGPVGGLLGLLFVGGVTVYVGYVGYERLTVRLREEAEAAAERSPEAVTDGGDET